MTGCSVPTVFELGWDPRVQLLGCTIGEHRSLEKGRPAEPELFTTMLVADLLRGRVEHRVRVDRMLDSLEAKLDPEGLFCFFEARDRLPPDSDCTALGLSVLLDRGPRIEGLAHAALDRMAGRTGAGGVVETYLDPQGTRLGRLDPVVGSNVLTLAAMLGRRRHFDATRAYVLETLRSGAYLEGTRYYHSPDSLLYFAARYYVRSRDGELGARVGHALVGRLGASAWPLELAQRQLVARWLGKTHLPAARAERELLLGMVRADGSWPADSLFHHGRSQVFYGSEALVTAFAIAALDGPRG